MYLTYEEYQNMGGALDETTFTDFEMGAEVVVNWYTFNRLKHEETYPAELGPCMFALIKLMKLKADALTLGAQTTVVQGESGSTTTVVSAAIGSQSNDGVSISYNTVTASDVLKNISFTSRGGEVENTVQMYLQGVVNSLGHRLLYRGVYPNE